jgi:hypothetical protein
MFHGIVKDSAALYAGTKLVKKAKKTTKGQPAMFTDAFKKKAFEATLAKLEETNSKLEAYIAKKELEIQIRKTQVTK